LESDIITWLVALGYEETRFLMMAVLGNGSTYKPSNDIYCWAEYLEYLLDVFHVVLREGYERCHAVFTKRKRGADVKCVEFAVLNAWKSHVEKKTESDLLMKGWRNSMTDDDRDYVGRVVGKLLYADVGPQAKMRRIEYYVGDDVDLPFSVTRLYEKETVLDPWFW
jgi:hypothetical protein